MLVADVVLLAGVWLDGRWAPRPRSPGLEIVRDAPLALSVGRSGEVVYRWANRSGRRARLRVREVRPELLGGVQPPRALTVAPRGERRETLAVVPVRRGRARGGDGGGGGGGFFVDSVGPLGLGLRRETVPLPWEVTVYPPIVSMRLRASVAQSVRRREQGATAVRRLGEGRLFESLRAWVPGDDIRHIDWKATARRRKVITRQYEAERRQQVLLVVDTGRLMTADIAGTARLCATPSSTVWRRCGRRRRPRPSGRRPPKSCCGPAMRRWATCGGPVCWCWTCHPSVRRTPWSRDISS